MEQINFIYHSRCGYLINKATIISKQDFLSLKKTFLPNTATGL